MMSQISAWIFGGVAGLIFVLAPIWMSRSTDQHAETIGLIFMLGSALFIFLLIKKWFDQRPNRTQ
jgi:hypothetical protein